MTPATIVVPALVLILSFLYVKIFYSIYILMTKNSGVLSEGQRYIFATIGTLISTVAVIVVGVQPKPDAPAIFLIMDKDTAVWVATGIQFLLVLIWILSGAVSLYAAYFAIDSKIASLNEAGLLMTNHAKAFLGFAIAAIYAFLRIPQ